MLRLIAVSVFGLWAGLMFFGRDLSPDELAQLETRRSARTPLTTQLSNTFAAAFGTDSRRQGAYVPTLAELPTRAAEPTSTQNAPAQVTQARMRLNPAAVTQVSDPEKLAAALNVTAAARAPITAATVAPAVAPTVAPSDTAAQAIILREVTASRVNVRSGPSTASPVLGQVVRAEIVRVTSPIENGWVKIAVEGDGVEGYMAAKFLTSVSH